MSLNINKPKITSIIEKLLGCFGGLRFTMRNGEGYYKGPGMDDYGPFCNNSSSAPSKPDIPPEEGGVGGSIGSNDDDPFIFTEFELNDKTFSYTFDDDYEIAFPIIIHNTNDGLSWDTMPLRVSFYYTFFSKYSVRVGPTDYDLSTAVAGYSQINQDVMSTTIMQPHKGMKIELKIPNNINVKTIKTYLVIMKRGIDTNIFADTTYDNWRSYHDFPAEDFGKKNNINLLVNKINSSYMRYYTTLKPILATIYTRTISHSDVNVYINGVKAEHQLKFSLGPCKVAIAFYLNPQYNDIVSTDAEPTWNNNVTTSVTRWVLNYHYFTRGIYGPDD